MGESMQLVQRMTSVLSARPELHAALADVERLTRTLVPWEDMGISAYNANRHEFVVLADTSSAVPPGTRQPATEGMPGLAMRAGRAVTDGELPSEARPEAGSEILLPLKYGDRLVGLWSVRHSQERDVPRPRRRAARVHRAAARAVARARQADHAGDRGVGVHDVARGGDHRDDAAAARVVAGERG